MNLLLIAPLYDNKGSVRYFLGAQVDVSHLIEGGKGIETFEKLLANDRAEERYRGRSNRKPTQVLGELGQMMNDDELDAINTRQRSQSRSSTPATSSRNPIPIRHGRKVFGMDDSSEHGLWPHPSLGPSGRLPGVYQNVSLFPSSTFYLRLICHSSIFSFDHIHLYVSPSLLPPFGFQVCSRQSLWNGLEDLRKSATVCSIVFLMVPL